MKSISGKDFCDVLRRRGWTLVRIRGSHHKYRSPDGRTLVVPVHGNKTIGKGLQRELMKDAGLTDDDL